MGLKFYKMSGLGNDFIFLDNFDRKLAVDPAELARRLCPRRVSVGADGLAILEPDPDGKADFRWRFHNADGSEAEMCGNASRCAARLAFDLGRVPPRTSLSTKAGVVRAEVSGRVVKVEMIRPFGANPKFGLTAAGKELDLGFINTGVPHAVALVPDVTQVDVETLGRAVRRHDEFSPAGTNANFITLVSPGLLKLRTFERGVEGETLACGTGAVASALVAHLRGLVKPPTRVEVASGEEIIVHYPENPQGQDPWPGPVFMEGATTLVYVAEVSPEVWP